ncbi:MAG TPA: type II toxin-antitoxin system VapC family toxin [Polyangia bacterium]|nr:type II toxin-antitoxin system VapC family toxin [Polyangia bacterium]
MIALDASALLAFLFREPGHERVAEAMPGCCMSTVNLAEVLGRFERDGRDAALVHRRLRTSGIAWIPFGVEHAAAAAALVPVTRHLGLSLGDRACLALARTRHIAALTADRAWGDLDPAAIGIEMEIIR